MVHMTLPALLSAIVFAAIVLLICSSLLSLDWRRRPRAETEALPVLRDANGQPDGLVQIDVGELRFRARVANLAAPGDTLILLHGFPQTSAAWEPVIEAAVAKGYRVVAFDQRGYSPGARPTARDSYALDKLIGDVLAVADVVGADRFHLAGHDWGCGCRLGGGDVFTRTPAVVDGAVDLTFLCLWRSREKRS